MIAHLLLNLWLLSAGAASAETAPLASELPQRMLLEGAYPIEVTVPFHVALLHWLDSLAGLEGAGATSGKTARAHRLAYERLHGAPPVRDRELLERFGKARIAYVHANPDDRDGLTLAFLESPNLPEALAQVNDLLPEAHVEPFREALRHFAPRYLPLWRYGRDPEQFLRRATDEQRAALTSFLVRLAAFYGVAADRQPHPRVVLVPVPGGFGTHAQTIGRFLLIEIREGEALTDEMAPIVHETAHLLYERMAPVRRASLERAALAMEPTGPEAWRLLREALPTAIAQGVAGQSLVPGDWSMESRWYHLEPVDAYAKQIFPLVKRALESGARLDEKLVRSLLGAFDRSPGAP